LSPRLRFDLVLNNLTAWAVSTGKVLLKKSGRFATFRGRPDVFVAGGFLWLGSNTSQGLDIRTGKVARQLKTAGLFTPGHHTRCYRARATENYLLWSKRGVEFMDINDTDHSTNDWVRSTCRYGAMPANGLLYTFPTPCFCFPGVKKDGFNALSATDGAVAEGRGIASRIVKGEAFGRIAAAHDGHADDWPTYRHDNARSGATGMAVAATLTEAWRTAVGGTVTPPVVALGRLYVARKDDHSVVCLDTRTGNRIWRFIAGGPVDSPPTIHEGRVIFGCSDGRVYCLDAASGLLVWRFQAAPFEKRIVSYGSLTSAWPVHGSVVVENGTVYCAAGISSYLDTGIHLYALRAADGETLHRTQVRDAGPGPTNARTSAHDMHGARNDILVTNGRRLFLTQNVFDMDLKHVPTKRIGRYGALETDLHLVASGGFLDDSGFDRLYWMYARRWPGLYYADKASKAGQILAFDGNRTYGAHKFDKSSVEARISRPAPAAANSSPTTTTTNRCSTVARRRENAAP
jgi:hypothetical protein